MNSPIFDIDFSSGDIAESDDARGVRTRPTPPGFEQRLLARARRGGVGRGDRLVVGFSGGRDSLALAAGLRRTRDALGVEMVLVHVDHRLRAESGREARQAEALADRLGVRFQLARMAAAATELHPGVGVEEAARRERYRLLGAAAAKIGAKAVVTGHHQQDQAETVLLHLMRGSGVHGAAGMREWSRAPFATASSNISHEVSVHSGSEGDRGGGQRPRLWRPLLHEPRSAIEAYVGSIGLTWIEDSSNVELHARRNVVRHEILPILEAWWPGASAALARYAELAGEDDDALDHLAKEALRGEVDPGGRLRAGLLGEHHPGLQRRIVRRWLWDVTGSREYSAERVDALLQLAMSGRGGRTVQVGGSWTVELREGMLSARRYTDGWEGQG